MKKLIKTLVFASVVLLTATSHASSRDDNNDNNNRSGSDQASWVGETPNLTVCVFSSTEDGTMTYSDDNRTWTTTSPAVFNLEFRADASSVEVTTDGRVILDNGNKFTGNSVVSYAGTTTEGVVGLVSSFGDNKYVAKNDDKNSGDLVIEVAGTAVMTDGFLDLQSGKDYFIEHTATCIQ